MQIRRGGAPRSKDEAAASLDRQLLLALINNLSDAVMALDPAYNILITNGAALDLVNKNELKGLELSTTLVLIDKTGNQIDLPALIQKSPTGYASRDLRLRLNDGTIKNLYICIVPARLSYGFQDGGPVLIMRDITDEKIMEEERDDFINVAGHELRTPVTIAESSISNALLMAQRNGASDTLIQSLKTAHDQTIFLSSMINDLAILSRADRGKLAMNIEIFNVGELLQELAVAYTPQAQTKNLTLGFEQPRQILLLCSSRLYVGEILQNLITNSLKYTLTGGIQITVLPVNGGVQFRVTDTGIGISQTDQQKMFNKFFRSNDERVKSQHGTGLGLYITGKLAALLRATVQLQSELNTGTTFIVTFPNLAIEQKTASQTTAGQAQPLAKTA